MARELDTTVPKRVLLVEDEAIIALAEQVQLERHGYTVTVTATGEEAIAEATGDRVDIILMDIDLGPGKMDGTQAAQQILAARELPIVFLTSHSEREMVERVRGITRYGYVLKGSGEFVLNQSIEMAFDLFDAKTEAVHNERMLMTALDNSHAGIAIAEAPEGRLRYVNDAGLLIRDSDRRTVVNGVGIDDYVSSWNIKDLDGRPLDWDEVPLARAVAYGETNSRRFIIQRDNHEDRVVLANAAPVLDRNGNVTEAIVIFLDITDQYEKDRDLRWQANMLEAAGDSIIATDFDGTIRYMNRYAELLYGWSRDEAIGRSVLDVTVPEQSVDRARDIMDRLKRGESWSGDFVVHHRSGRRFVARVRDSVLTDEHGSPQGVVAVSYKVSDDPSLTGDAGENYLKTELYELVRTDRAIFDFLQAGSLDGIWYWDLERQENEWMSPRFWRLFGYDPATKNHSSSEWQDLIDPEDLKVATENLEKHLADPNHPYDQVVRYRHADGGTIWVRCRGIAIRDVSGRPVRMLGAHNDLTELKRSEERLRDLVEHDRNELIEKETLLAELNHRVKNNLATVSSLVRIEDERVGEAADLSDIVTRIETIMALHQHLQDVGTYDTVDLNRYLDRVARNALGSLRDAEVTNAVEPTRVSARLATTVGLIVNELATNAMKHGFTDAEPKRFTIESRMLGSTCELAVTNSGRSFPEDIALDAADSVGLRLVNALVAQLGGEISVKRSPRPVFTVRFAVS